MGRIYRYSITTTSGGNISAHDEDGKALVIGRTILDAFDRLELPETTSEAVNNAGFLGNLKSMDDAVVDELIGTFSN